MNKSTTWGSRATSFFKKALAYVSVEDPEGLRWVEKISSRTFERLTPRQFMTEYVWVVYAAGFRVAVIEEIFPQLSRAFHNLHMDKIAKMRSTASVLRVFGNRRKAKNVVEGARMIMSEGFDKFKKRVLDNGVDSLADLPGIGQITKDHLARNIGLASVAKNDIWIARTVKVLSAPSHQVLAEHLSARFRKPPGVVDYIIWKFCVDAGWRKDASPSLAHFAGTLRGVSRRQTKGGLSLPRTRSGEVGQRV